VVWHSIACNRQLATHDAQPLQSAALIQISPAELACLIGFFDLGQGQANHLAFLWRYGMQVSAVIRLGPSCEGKEMTANQSARSVRRRVDDAGAAQAQLLPTWETQITPTQQDLDMIRGALTNQVHGKPVGTTASWSNPPPATRDPLSWSRNSL
jgi:hypothetical protein